MRLRTLIAGLACLAALTMSALPDAALAAAPAVDTPGIGSAIERALGSEGAGEDTPLSFSLQLLVLMSLLTILPATHALGGSARARSGGQRVGAAKLAGGTSAPAVDSAPVGGRSPPSVKLAAAAWCSAARRVGPACADDDASSASSAAISAAGGRGRTR